MARAYFPLFFDRYLPQLDVLDDASAGRLFKAAVRYAKWGEVPDLPGMEKVTWASMRDDIDTSIERYEYRCLVNAANGMKGGRPKLENYPEKPNGFVSPPEGPDQRQCKSEEEYKFEEESKKEAEGEKKVKKEAEADRENQNQTSKQNQKKPQAEEKAEGEGERKAEEEEAVHPRLMMKIGEMRKKQTSSLERRQYAEEIFGRPWEEISLEDKKKFYTAILGDDIIWQRREAEGIVEPVG